MIQCPVRPPGCGKTDGHRAAVAEPDDYASGASPSSRSTARPMSGCRISDSPTRMAETPAASSRSTSARVRMPLSLTSTTSGGIRSRSRSVWSRR